MARSATAGNLFITVGGDVTPLKAAMTAGKSVLNEFGSAAIDVQAEVTKAFADMAANAPAAAKQLEQSYSQSFAQIRKNAQAVLSAPTPAGAAAVINATGAREAAAAAEAEAAALRMVADAAARADAATLGNSTGTRAYAIAAEAAAQQSATYAAGLRSQAQVLGQVQAQLVAGGGAQQKFAANQNNITLGANNARIAQMEYMHVVRGTMDQLAAGAPITQVLAMHMSMLSEAVALSGAGMGKFGAIMSGPWGLAIMAGVSILAMLAGKHGAAKTSADDHRDAEQTLIASLMGEKVANDALIDSLIKINDQRSKSLETTNQQIQAEYDLARASLDHANANKAALQSELDRAKAAAAAPETITPGGSAQTSARSEAEARVVALQSQIDGLDRQITEAMSTMATDITAGARDLATHVGQATELFNRKRAELEAKYKGDPTYSHDSKGNVVTTYRGGELNSPGLTDPRRAQLVQELNKAEHDLNVEREKAIDAARELDKAEVGHIQTQKEAIDGFLKGIPSAEGLGHNQSGSPAFGVGQFFPGTFEHYYQKAYGQPVPSGQMDNFRANKTIAEGVLEAAANDYANKLKAAGQQVTSSALYAVHLLNAGSTHITDAIHLLNAPASEPTSSFLKANVIKQNYSLLNGTAGDVRARIAAKFGDGSSTISSGASAIQQALKEQAEKELQQQSAYTSERNRLNEQILSAVGQLHLNYQAEAQAALEQVAAEHQAEADKISSNLAEGKYGAATSKLAQARATSLQLANDQLAEQRTTNVLVKKFNDQLEEQQKDEDQRYQLSSDTLQYEAQIARTIDARRQIELDIVDALYEHKKNVLEIQRQSAVEAQHWGDVARIDAQLAHLPGEKAQATDLANRQNQSPMDAYLNSLPQSLADVHQRLEEIEVTGLKTLNSDLGDATAKALGLSGALGQTVSRMVQLGLEIAESKLGGAWGKNGAAGQSAQLSTAGGQLSAAGATLNTAGSVLHSSALIWQGVAEQLQLAATQLETAGAMGGSGFNGGMLASLFGGASSMSLGAMSAAGGGGFMASFASSTLPTFALAGGGLLSGPGTPTSDSIPLWGSDGEYMVRAAAVRKLGVPFLDAINSGKVPQHRKHGGLLGTLLPFFAGAAFSFLTHGNPLIGAGLIGGAFSLANKVHGPLGDILRFAISPAAFLGEELLKHKHSSASVPSSMLSAQLPAQVATNSNQPLTSVVNNHNITVQGTGDPLEDRQTGMQYAAGFDAELARRRAKGIV